MKGIKNNGPEIAISENSRTDVIFPGHQEHVTKIANTQIHFCGMLRTIHRQMTERFNGMRG